VHIFPETEVKSFKEVEERRKILVEIFIRKKIKSIQYKYGGVFCSGKFQIFFAETVEVNINELHIHTPQQNGHPNTTLVEITCCMIHQKRLYINILSKAIAVATYLNARES
jgi:threonine dehydrogenase-like Zn-dependent dehydrogenase